ncbi:MAG TPA: AraC family transcriptional regulator [Burkholderiaceae bacterium]|nr:AraC family transcriptional regulator [Burkholderiaceae bacterium]
MARSVLNGAGNGPAGGKPARGVGVSPPPLSVPADLERQAFFHVRQFGGAELILGDHVVASGRPALHEDVEIRLVTAGEVRVRIDGESRLLPAGTLLRIPPAQLHSFADGSTYSFLALHVAPSLLQRRGHPAWHPQGLETHATEAARAEVIAAACAALQALSEGAPAPESADRVITALVDWAATVESRVRSRPASRVPAIDRALAYLREHYARELAIDDVAAAAGLSKFYFVRLFASTLGVTPHRYQMLLRVACSRRLLRAGTDIAEVATHTGFFDQSHFTRCFREIVGVTPGRYQLEVS